MVILICPWEKSVCIFCLNFELIHEPLINVHLSSFELLTSTFTSKSMLQGVFSIQIWAVFLIFIAAYLVSFVMVVNRTEFTIFATFNRISC